MPARQKVLLLDGGLGHLLKSKGVETVCSEENLAFDDLFIAGTIANELRPDIVADAHREYIQAGAEIISVNCFNCTRYSLAKIKREGDVKHLLDRACEIAMVEKRRATSEVLVAGILPPLMESYDPSTCAVLHPPSSSSSSGSPPGDDRSPMSCEYDDMVDIFSAHGVDIFLCETMASSQEALVAVGSVLRRNPQATVWVSYTLDDTISVENGHCRLRSGEQLGLVIEELVERVGVGALDAVLVNCCSPVVVSAAIGILQEISSSVAARQSNTDKDAFRIGGYANGFRMTTTEWLIEKGTRAPLNQDEILAQAPSEYFDEQQTDDQQSLITPLGYTNFALEWISKGASVIGGCCGVGPEHIRAVARAVGCKDQGL